MSDGFNAHVAGPDGGPELSPGDGGTTAEVFQIIDETGEGFGFELTPQTLAKPLAIGAGALFSVGMLAGVPFGLALGRAQQDKKGAKVVPSLSGLKFAATTFGLGTLLCGVIGTAAFYGVRSYYKVDSFEEFGVIMRRDVPHTRLRMETSLSPILDSVRRNVGDNLPGPMQKLRMRFVESKFGIWLKNQVDSSVTFEDVDPASHDHAPPKSQAQS